MYLQHYAAATIVVLLGLGVRPSESLSCFCGAAPCEDPTCCPSEAGLVLDACGCCKVCAKGLDDPCGGPWRTSGVCGAGLSCLRQCECKTEEGSDCVFPFKFKGKSYSQCTYEGSENGKAWCAVTLDPTGEVVEGEWGDCRDGCPGTAYQCDQGEIFNLEGRCVPTDRADIEANQQLQYSLDEGAESTEFAPLCPAASKEPTCTCVREVSSSHQRGEGCSETSSRTKGWCFLTNVNDPSNPGKDCYPDASWSAANGRFWSGLACGASGGDGLIQDGVILGIDDEPPAPPSPPPPPGSR